MTHLTELKEHDQLQLDKLYNDLTNATDTFAGYPCNAHFDYSELYRFLKFPLNNIGDPFSYSNYQINTHPFEQEVIKFFANLLKANNYFSGYVCHGGTEGNLYGIDLGLQRFPGAIIYHSESTHYSIDKISRLLKSPIEKIPALDNGEINYEILQEKLKKNNDKPAVINVNIGTTMTGAVDNLNNIKEALKNANISDFHLHADAALNGMILPFIDNPQPHNFEDGIHSIAISGHKFIGSPLPCGIVLTNQKPPDLYEPTIAYVKITDNTISGSRNGITPLILWYAIKRYGITGFQKLVQQCFEHIDYALETFQSAGIPAWKNKNSITLVFPRPSERIVTKWQLAPNKDISHMVIMPHINKPLIDRICEDITE